MTRTEEIAAEAAIEFVYGDQPATETQYTRMKRLMGIVGKAITAAVQEQESLSARA